MSFCFQALSCPNDVFSFVLVEAAIGQLIKWINRSPSIIKEEKKKDTCKQSEKFRLQERAWGWGGMWEPDADKSVCSWFTRANTPNKTARLPDLQFNTFRPEFFESGYKVTLKYIITPDFDNSSRLRQSLLQWSIEERFNYSLPFTDYAVNLHHFSKSTFYHYFL